jgi:hypothetical protein
MEGTDMAEQTAGCVHRWALSDPRPATIHGVCRRCGATRVYPSALEFYEPVPDYDELERGVAVQTYRTVAEERPAA